MQLSLDHCRSRYDFSLSSLAYAWGESWTEESHMSFQPQFRQAVKTVAMSCHRLNMPMELARRIASCLHRDWWRDEYRSCWNYDCHISNIGKSVELYHNAVKDGNTDTQLGNFLFTSNGLNSTFRECEKCRVTKYCSKRCQEESYRASHVSHCGKLPCRKGRPSESEHHLYDTVFACREMQGQLLPLFISNNIPLPVVSNNTVVDNDYDDDWEDEEDDDDNEDEDNDWESVDSNYNENEPESATTVIHNFFRNQYNDAT
jgi:hypothetical protein